MTALEKWEALLKESGVTYEKMIPGPPKEGEAYVERYHDHISLSTDEGEGYAGFMFIIRFDLDGNFVSYGAWE